MNTMLDDALDTLNEHDKYGDTAAIVVAITGLGWLGVSAPRAYKVRVAEDARPDNAAVKASSGVSKTKCSMRLLGGYHAGKIYLHFLDSTYAGITRNVSSYHGCNGLKYRHIAGITT
jgi:hypothetical protein